MVWAKYNVLLKNQGSSPENHRNMWVSDHHHKKHYLHPNFNQDQGLDISPIWNNDITRLSSIPVTHWFILLFILLVARIYARFVSVSVFTWWRVAQSVRNVNKFLFCRVLVQQSQHIGYCGNMSLSNYIYIYIYRLSTEARYKCILVNTVMTDAKFITV